MLGEIKKKKKYAKLNKSTARKIFFVLLVLFFIITPLVLVLSKHSQVDAAWFNENWLYRQKISISGNGADLEDYQVRLSNIDTASLYSEGKMKRMCEDIRFTDIQGNLLDYWIEEDDIGCNQDTSTDFWVKIPRLESEGTTLFLYYGNVSANAYQNGSRTFELFDTFDGLRAQSGSGSGVDWYDVDWNKRYKVTINSSQVPNSDQIDFPVYIDLADFEQEFFSSIKNDGSDIIVIDADGTTELPREVIGLDVGSQVGELWFKAPVLSYSQDNEFYIYFENPAGNSVNDPDVWSNYHTVHHMQDDPSGAAPQMLDSTDTYDGSAIGGLLSSDSVDGQIGKSVHFDGSNDYIDLPDGFSNLSGGYTISAWVYMTNYGGWQRIMDFGNGSSNNNILLARDSSSANLTLHVYNGGSSSSTTAPNAITNDAWQLFTVTENAAGQTYVYKNGSLVGSGSNYVPPIVTRTNNYIGRSNWSDAYYQGNIDEFRIASAVRSADWIATEYNNQSDPASFYTISELELGNYTEILHRGVWEQSGAAEIDGISETITISQETGIQGIRSRGTFPVNSQLITRAIYSDTRNWYNTNWQYRIAIEIDSTKVGGATQTGIPVYANLSDLGSEFFDNVKADGSDIVVTNATGTKLKREVPSINVSTKTGQLWFNADSVSASSNSVFYIYYGNASATETNDTDTWDTNYIMVQHLEESSGTANDASQNNGDGTYTGTTRTGAKLGYGHVSTNDSQYINATVSNLPVGNAARTLEAWFYPTSDSGASISAIFGYPYNAYNGFTNSWFELKYSNTGDSRFGFHVYNNQYSSANTFPKDNWYHLIATHDGTALKLYVNGVLEINQSITLNTQVNPSGTNFNIYREVNHGDAMRPGKIDEVRASNTARNQSYVTFQYINQRDTNLFYRVSSQQQFSTSSPTLEARVGFSNATWSQDYEADDSVSYLVGHNDNTLIKGTSNEGTSSEVASSLSHSVSEHFYRVGFTSTGNYARDYVTDGTVATNVPNEPMNVRVEVSSSTDSITLYWIAVAKSSASPPTTFSFSDEELNENRARTGFENIDSLTLARYAMDEQSWSGLTGEVIDDSGVYNGTAVNGATTVPGISGMAGDFDDGSKYVSLPLITNKTTDLAVSLWVNLDSTAESGAFFKNGTSTGFGIGVGGYEFDNNGNDLILLFEAVRWIDTGIPIGTGWHHIVMQLDTSGVPSVYLDGDYKGSYPGSNSNTPTGSAGIGGYTTRYVDATIDDLRVLNGTISEAEVESLYFLEGADITQTGQDNELEEEILNRMSSNVTDVTSGLITHLKMDEESWAGVSGGVLDSSSSQLHGTAVNGINTSPDSILGRAGSFDGVNDYIDMPDGYASFPNGVTFSFWTYPAANSYYARFIDFGNGSGSDNIILARYSNSNDLDYSVYYGGSGSTVRASGVIEQNKWQHFTVTQNASGSVVMYKNGAQVQTGTANVINNVSRVNNYIGRSNWGGDAYYYGKIDEFRIYDKVLTAVEVQDTYVASQAEIGSRWSFEEKSGIVAVDSISAYNANFSAGMTSANWNPEGRINRALSFDGTDDYLSVSDTGELDITSVGSFTVTSWIKTNGAVSANSIILKKGGLGNAIGYSLYLNATGQVVCGIDDDSTSFPEDSVTSTAEYDNSAWHFVVCTKNKNTSLQLYVDGNLAGTDSTISAIGSLSNAESLLIGGQSTGSYFNGYLDEVNYYPYPVSSQVIFNNYRSMIGASTSDAKPGLIAYWAMDETSWNGTGGEVFDSSGYGHSGYAVNGANTTLGVKGKAGNFDGTNDRIQLPSTSVIGTRSTFSISVWVYPRGYPDSQCPIFGEFTSGHTRNYLYTTNGGRPVFDQYLPGGGAITANNALTLNAWNHIVYTRTPSRERFYINNTLDHEETGVETYSGGAPTTANIGMWIGPGYNWNGMIDELRIFDYELTTENIADEYSLNTGNSQDLLVSTEKMGGSADSLVALYNFNNKSGTIAYDSALHSLNGILTNMDDSDWVTGKEGNGLDFDGVNDRVNITHTSQQILTSQVSLSAWINSTTTAADEFIISKSELCNSSNANYNLRLRNDYLVFSYFDGTGVDNYYYSNQTVPNNEWVHVAATYNYQTYAIDLYINGQLVSGYWLSGNTPNNPTPSTTTNALTIGGIRVNSSVGSCSIYAVGATGWPFTGKIDEVKIWNEKLSARDIMIDFNGGAPVGWWKMDRGEGNTAYDYSGNDNHGTMTNMDPATDWLSEEDCAVGGSCLDFDGSNDYVAGPNLGISTNSVSISAWVKPANVSGDKFIVGESDLSGGSSGNDEYRLELIGSNFRCLVGNGSLFAFSLASDITVEANKWYHVTCTYDRNNLRIYINGNLEATTPSTVGIENTSVSLTIGRSSHASVFNYFSGLIDELKIFNYQLSSEDVKVEYNKGSALRFE